MRTDFWGTIGLIAMIITCIGTVANAVPGRHGRRAIIVLGAGLWVGLQIALTNAGAYTGPGAVVFLGISVALPPLATLIAAAVWQDVRDALHALPIRLLVGLNVARTLGLFFLLLAADGRLSGPFPLSAGGGDILTGVVALWFAVTLVQPERATSMLTIWNTFGFVDLLVAVSLGVLSAPGSPLYLFQSGSGSAAIRAVPWSLIPTVMVPFYLIVHGVIFVRLRKGVFALPRSFETARLGPS